jgi:hypothetical protein
MRLDGIYYFWDACFVCRNMFGGFYNGNFDGLRQIGSIYER